MSIPNHPLFQKAIQNIPDADIKLIQTNYCSKHDASIEQIRFLLASTRWSNKICDVCWDKTNIAALIPCQQCGLAFYCSDDCRQIGTPSHTARCCKLDGPLDSGPQAIAIVTVDNAVKQSDGSVLMDIKSMKTIGKRPI